MMENKIETFLKSLNLKTPVLDLPFPNIYPCITYHIYMENGALFGAGTATEKGAMCQADIWYKAKNSAVKREIDSVEKAIKNEKYFSYPSKGMDYETNTKIYHTYFNFELINESGEDNE